ncbi:hypothetical protein TPA0906_00300 [Streptomyces olivaceus]|uniref:DUF6233 domain-containing protein n=1 Tax=Streptomyces olivaceus TaxID=47716 RepID=UPI0022ED4C65|nr:DUF6233 domain-containing protein [Streptomyces olivaceus]GHI98164.1 hypothetical protein TPA0906_00300 [Streptomyces olivaceus]
MSDSIVSRLAQLRFLERVQERDLARTRRWIAVEECKKAELRRAETARPPAPDWLLERGLNGQAPPVYVHVGGCWNAGNRSTGISREEALRALAEGVSACSHCRPDAELRSTPA